MSENNYKNVTKINKHFRLKTKIKTKTKTKSKIDAKMNTGLKDNFSLGNAPHWTLKYNSETVWGWGYRTALRLREIAFCKTCKETNNIENNIKRHIIQ